MFSTEVSPTATLSDSSYDSYTINLSYDDYQLENGVITVKNAKSVYSPLDGVVSSIIQEANGFSVEITHSNNFKTKINGLTNAYCQINERVYKNIPLGYLSEANYSVCFYDNESMITNYDITNDTVVWQN